MREVKKELNKIGNLFLRLFKKKKPAKVGIALGSGGLFGLSHIGVLKILEKNKIPIDCIVGCSMGAVIGAYYSLNPDISKLEEIVNKLKKWDLIRLIDVNMPKISLISGNKIRSFLEKFIGDKCFSDTKIPLMIVATDLGKGEEIVLKEGKLIDAIMASISIPGIFPPIKLGEKILVDGGVINSTPTNVINKMGAEIIIGVDLTMKYKTELNNPKIYQTLMRSYEILRTQSTKFNINKDDENLLIIKPDTTKLKSFKFHEIQKFIDEGERVAREALPEIKNLMKKKDEI